MDDVPWDVVTPGFNPNRRTSGMCLVELRLSSTGPPSRSAWVTGRPVAWKEAHVYNERVQLYGANSLADFEFAIPGGPAPAIKSLLFSLRSPDGSSRPPNSTVSGFHWRRRQWVPWPAQDDTARAPAAADFVNPDDQRVQVRVTGGGTLRSNAVLEYEREP